MTNDEHLLALRTFEADIKANKSEVEEFQHRVLRPVLKHLNEKLLALIAQETHFQLLLKKSLPAKEKELELRNFIKKNKHFKFTSIGLTCALFTTEEFEFYLAHKKDLDKRISQMVEERVVSQF
ncbi:hypothetical protein SAMN05216474_2685 [Lishizhenia tianjinensis]|uniref:Glyoxalase n=1 Tax=Lishizhenia tianjinensis TaxID=477690 RepID=A0A1I7BCQ4_9FLAO|nr:hypothetical protein [Lishizhenia tianjinensis]SFT84976.1 hypothetical protein SAMN05216474_2685 [Lishizhenia tianjinensis]